jgi:hypothetical protein
MYTSLEGHVHGSADKSVDAIVAIALICVVTTKEPCDGITDMTAFIQAIIPCSDPRFLKLKARSIFDGT